jgi:hypothetical protein
MPLVLDSTMCEIIDLSKDSKPTKKEIEEKNIIHCENANIFG